MSTLVTGVFGCIGSWVVRALLARSERPIASISATNPWRRRRSRSGVLGIRII